MPVKTTPKTGLAGRFTLASPTIRHRLIFAGYGEVGTLKTSFGLGMPKPLLVIDGDQGTEGLVEERVARGEEIYLEQFSSNVADLRDIKDDDERQAAAEEVATRIEDAYYYAIDNGIKSILIDKEGQFYDIVKYAVLGGKESDNPNRFYPVNQRMGALIEAAKASDINLMLAQGMRTPWVSEVKGSGKIGAKPSKDRERKGWKMVEEQVMMNIEFLMRRNDDGEAEFFMNIGKVRGYGGRGLQYTEIPYVEFPEFATGVFPDTSQEDWA
jgi:hypothetical protein